MSPTTRRSRLVRGSVLAVLFAAFTLGQVQPASANLAGPDTVYCTDPDFGFGGGGGFCAAEFHSCGSENGCGANGGSITGGTLGGGSYTVTRHRRYTAHMGWDSEGEQACLSYMTPSSGTSLFWTLFGYRNARWTKSCTHHEAWDMGWGEEWIGIIDWYWEE